MAKLDHENIWRIAKFVRKSVLYEMPSPKCESVLLSDDDVKSNIDYFAKELKLDPSSIPNNRVSYQTLEVAGEVFTYLNYCPPNLIPLITHILKTETPKDIILAFTSIMKTSDRRVRESSKEIFLKIMESFKLKQYEKIQRITKGKCYTNGKFRNCTSNLNEEDLKLYGLFLL